MKIQLLSDLHREFDRMARRAPVPTFDVIPDSGAEIIVLAGDIDTGLTGVRWAVGEAERLQRPIFYVFGNHEYYGNAIPRLLDKGRTLAHGTGVHLLERDAVVLDGIRFLGCTLWTDFALLGQQQWAMVAAAGAMIDFRRVRVSPHYRKVQPQDLLAEHRSSMAWLQQQLAQPDAPPTVVISHHGPSGRSLPAAYRDDELAPAYASDLEVLMGPPALAWMHGHVHTPADYHVNGTRVLCNPRGYYPNELTIGFDAAKTLDLSSKNG